MRSYRCINSKVYGAVWALSMNSVTFTLLLLSLLNAHMLDTVLPKSQSALWQISSSRPMMTWTYFLMFMVDFQNPSRYAMVSSKVTLYQLHFSTFSFLLLFSILLRIFNIVQQVYYSKSDTSLLNLRHSKILSVTSYMLITVTLLPKRNGKCRL